MFKPSLDAVWQASALEGLATISVLDAWAAGHGLVGKPITHVMALMLSNRIRLPAQRKSHGLMWLTNLSRRQLYMPNHQAPIPSIIIPSCLIYIARVYCGKRLCCLQYGRRRVGVRLLLPLCFNLGLNHTCLQHSHIPMVRPGCIWND
jgi:hypothetical protein